MRFEIAVRAQGFFDVARSPVLGVKLNRFEVHHVVFIDQRLDLL